MVVGDGGALYVRLDKWVLTTSPCPPAPPPKSKQKRVIFTWMLHGALRRGSGLSIVVLNLLHNVHNNSSCTAASINSYLILSSCKKHPLCCSGAFYHTYMS